MPGARQDVVIERGATWELRLQYPLSAPLDLHTGWTAGVQLRHAEDDLADYADASLYVTLSAGSPTTPNLVLLAPPTWTLALVNGHYPWAWFIEQTGTPPTDPYRKYLLYGQATVVTRAAR